MSSDGLHPLSFDAASEHAGAADYLQDPAVRLLVDFFRAKGLEALKREDRQEEWYQDWIDYQAKHRLYASLLSPARYSSLGHRFSLLRLTRFLEVFAYVSPAHAYSLHVSFLGLFPILMSPDEALKREAVARLEAGGLFAFGVSEQGHGSDLLANEFTLTRAGSGDWVADGRKYYIGNANAACLISVLAKEAGGPAGTTRRSPFAFFALRPREAPALPRVRKIRTLGIRAAFVGEIEVRGHAVPAGDVFARGREAWSAVLGTVDFGKFFLGFGAVGACEHAFAEAAAHLRRRSLYGKPVTALPHIRAAEAFAFARLAAMKLYAYRALDYFQAAGADDRRYLLWGAVQKAKVSTEGVKVMALLSECVGARGFESETYLESALREVPLIPGLEGSTHINYALTAQFLGPYFARPAHEAAAPGSVALGQVDDAESPYWTEARDRTAKTVRFGHCLSAYRPLRSVRNVRLFVKQVKAFRRFAQGRLPGEAANEGADLVIATGRCFSVIAYAQLIAENCVAGEVAAATVSVIFHALIEDLASEALKLSAMFPPRSSQRALSKRAVQVPATSDADLRSVSELIEARYGVGARSGAPASAVAGEEREAPAAGHPSGGLTTPDPDRLL